MKYLIIIVCLFTMLACGKKDGPDTGVPTLSTEEIANVKERATQLFGTLPAQMPGSEKDTPARIALGHKLYFETALSVNGTQSCNTCHDITNGMAGVDNLALSPGALEDSIGTRNSPTVFNAGYQFVQFWDGRSPDLFDQAKGPILNPVEMAIPDEATAVNNIAAIEGYMDLFKLAFPEEANPLTFDNIAEAIAAFERTLISRSRFDDWMSGNPTAMSNKEILGLKTFIETGCITCHTGPLFGGNMYQKMGLVYPYERSADLGRYDVTGLESDKKMFKVAMLRNITLTHPYFHDGTVETLDEAIQLMSYHNLGRELAEQDIDYIKTFFQALTDKKLEKGEDLGLGL